MKPRHVRLWLWGLVLSAVAVLANWPRHGIALKDDLWAAGFPMTYAYGSSERTVDFRVVALLVDVLIWAGAFAAIAFGDWYVRRRAKSLSEQIPESSRDDSSMLDVQSPG